MTSHILKIAICSLAVLSGCADIQTKQADLSKPPEGIRVFVARVYLFVDEPSKKSQLVYAPDFTRGYDIKPTQFLAKHDFTIEISDGQVSKLTSNQDTSAGLDFVKSAAQEAAKAAGAAVSTQTFEGTFGLKSGIYVLTDKGTFLAVTTQ